MSVASRRPTGHGARALEEALGAVAAPAVRDGILGSALSRDGLVAVPDEGGALEAFVRGSFHATIAARLGEDLADSVVGDLWPTIARMARRPKPATARPPTRATARPASPRPSAEEDASGVVVVGRTVRAGESLPVIIAAIRNDRLVRELAIALTGKAVVRPVADVVEMAEAIEDHHGELPVVLFDCGKPPFHLESVATFAGDLPCGSWLALLDSSSADERTARGFAGTTLTIVRLASTPGARELALQCLTLFD